MGMRADIFKQCAQPLLGKMESVRNHIAFFCITGFVILQRFRRIQELPVIFLAHLCDCLVVGINLNHFYIGICGILRNRRNCIHNNIHGRIGSFHRLNPLFITLYERVGFRTGAIEIIRAHRDDDPFRLQNRDRLRH